MYNMLCIATLHEWISLLLTWISSKFGFLHQIQSHLNIFLPKLIQNLMKEKH